MTIVGRLIGALLLAASAVFLSAGGANWSVAGPLLALYAAVTVGVMVFLGSSRNSEELRGTAPNAAELRDLAVWVLALDVVAWTMAILQARAETTPLLLAVLFVAALYIAIAARYAETRRHQMANAVRMARNSVRRLEVQSAELRDARTKAEEASAAKSEFLANMSHEMRTPLQGVIGMLQLALEDDVQGEQRGRQLETARRSAEALLGTINDILDFSKIEARKLDLEPVYFSLRQMMAETMKSLGVIAASKNLTLSYFVHTDVPDSVWADPLRLRQVLVNLVGNAIKFTQSGEIAVRVSRNETRVRFDIRDTGIGIPAELREQIFEPFTQADTSHSRRYGGTGLGLAIVARLLQAMGGTVNVASEPGAGSVFSFSIDMPTDPVAAAPSRRAWEASLAGKSMLIVEPAEMARAHIAEILRSRGIFASASADVAHAPSGRFICAITSDPSLPVKQRVLIRSPFEPITAELSVTRPVGERELIDAIGVALGFQTDVVEYTLERPDITEVPMRVLLVEDNEVNQEFVAEALRRVGHTVIVAGNGHEALDLLEREMFDIIFMDIQMPDIDGLEVTRRYRDRGGKTPIVALTAHNAREDRDRCLSVGMNDVLTKPVYSKQLAATIRTLTRRETVLDVVGGNRRLLARVTDAFARQTPELMAAMRTALETRDAEALHQATHKLKGSLANFPGERAAGMARGIDDAARAKDFARVTALLPPLASALAELEGRLSAAVEKA
ncbi:MAG TPA: ATP-binding protein [Thermoanaerobaculia bacterium]